MVVCLSDEFIVGDKLLSASSLDTKNSHRGLKLENLVDDRSIRKPIR